MLKRSLQVTLLVVYVALVSAWLVLGQGDSIQPMGRESLGSVLGILLWWTSPALAILLSKTWAGAVFTGVTLLAGSNIALLSIYSSTSSTAAIGFYTLPIVGWLIAIGALLAEQLILRLR